MAKLVDGSLVLPVYLICDTSSSMNRTVDGSKNGIRRIDILNEAITDLFVAIYKGSRTTVRVNVSVISFNSAPCLNFPLQDITPGVSMRPLQAGGLTELGKALKFFDERLTIDEAKRGHRRGYRPVAFVISDGQPTDNIVQWKEACARLASRSRPSLPPRIVPCMIADPCDDLVKSITAFYGRDLTSISESVLLNGSDVAKSIHSVFNLIAQTLNYSYSVDDTKVAEKDSFESQIRQMDAIFVQALEAPSNQVEDNFDSFFQEIL
jgi:von willebrand factor type A domain